MQYSIHKRRKLKTGKRQKSVLSAPVVERVVTGARRARQEIVPAAAVPEPDRVIAPEPEAPVIVAEAPEPSFADRRELIRIIHQTQSFPVGLQRTFTPLPPPEPDKVASGSVVAKRPTLDDD